MHSCALDAQPPNRPAGAKPEWSAVVFIYHPLRSLARSLPLPHCHTAPRVMAGSEVSGRSCTVERQQQWLEGRGAVRCDASGAAAAEGTRAGFVSGVLYIPYTDRADGAPRTRPRTGRSAASRSACVYPRAEWRNDVIPPVERQREREREDGNKPRILRSGLALRLVRATSRSAHTPATTTIRRHWTRPQLDTCIHTLCAAMCNLGRVGVFFFFFFLLSFFLPSFPSYPTHPILCTSTYPIPSTTHQVADPARRRWGYNAERY